MRLSRNLFVGCLCTAASIAAIATFVNAKDTVAKPPVTPATAVPAPAAKPLLPVTATPPVVAAPAPGTPERPIVAAPAASRAERSSFIDSQIARILMVDNKGEIALGNFGEQMAQSSEVKDVARMMVKDHTAFLSKLEKFGMTARGAFAQPEREAVTASGTIVKEKTPVGSGPQVNGAELAAGLDIVQLKQEMGDQCLATKKAELSKRKGHDFDHAYLHCLKAGHIEMLDMLAVYQRHATPEFQKLLDEGKHATQDHLDHINKALQDVDLHHAK